MPKKVDQENSCSPLGTDQGGLCLVEDSWRGHHVESQQSMVRLFITVKPCVKHGRLLPKREDVGHFNLSEISGHFPILGKRLVGPDLVFNPVGHQFQSCHSNLSNRLLEVLLGRRDLAVYVVISHVRELMPGLEELDFIKFGLNGSAKAESVSIQEIMLASVSSCQGSARSMATAAMVGVRKAIVLVNSSLSSWSF